jgi:hypothetical protein
MPCAASSKPPLNSNVRQLPVVAHHTKRSYLVALLAGMAGAAGGFAAYLFLGMATGVVAMCGWAPEWWAHAYFFLAVVVPAVGVWAGVAARRSYLWRRGELSDLGSLVREQK